MAIESEFRLRLERLLSRLDVSSDSVVLVHESDVISKLVSRDYLRILQDVVSEGTVSILGDCTLNTGADDHDRLSTQERLVLSSGPMLQLMTLQGECFYVSHPSLMIASVGKYARYLARHHELDFPYGPDSVFNDYYGMNTVVLFIGDKHDLVESKFVYAKRDDAVIRKDVTDSGSELLSYLDYHSDIDAVHRSFFSGNLLISENMGNHVVYGITFKEYIEYLNSQL